MPFHVSSVCRLAEARRRRSGLRPRRPALGSGGGSGPALQPCLGRGFEARRREGLGRAAPRRPHYKSREAARAEAGPARRARRRRLRGEAMPAAGSEGEEGAAGAGGGSAGEQPGPGPPKLCGYLQKLSGKGPLRGFRSRWFVFDPRRCYLYYFKGPQEALPLGHLDIASACFSYHQPEAGAAAAGDEAAAFEVHSPGGAVAVLKVGPGARPPPPSAPEAGPPSAAFPVYFFKSKSVIAQT